MIVYNKFPDVYDERVEFNWMLNEILEPKTLKDKTVLDVGSGTGQLAFMVAPYAKTVYAVEPLQRFREVIREKAQAGKIKNLFIVDGFLSSLPFPDHSVDVLLTSNAIGWSIDNELPEIERVVKPGGIIVHLMRTRGNKEKNPHHTKLISLEWGYVFTEIEEKEALRMKYYKILVG